jgi:transcriptional regulator with XRE-family HTH domain
MSTIGNRIKRVREMKNYTQEFMAGQLNISQNTYSRIENETVKLTTDRLQKIANALDVPVEYLVNLDAPIYNFNNEHASIQYSGHFENIYDSQNEHLKKTIELLENQLKQVNRENERLMSLLEKALERETFYVNRFT